MQKKINSLICIILILVFVFPITSIFAAAEDTNDSAIKTLYSKKEKQAVDNSVEIKQMKKQIKGLVKNITTLINGYEDIKDSITASPLFPEIQASLDKSLALLKNIEQTTVILPYIDNIKKAKNNNNYQIAEAAMQEVINFQQKKTYALRTIIGELNIAYDKAMTISEKYKVLLKEYNDFKVYFEQTKKIINENHIVIVKLNTDVRSLINRIVATASANNDILKSENEELEKILDNMKIIKDELNTLFAFQVRDAINELKTCLKNANIEGAYAALDKAVAIQDNRKTKLTEIKDILTKTLEDLNTLIANSAVGR